MSRTGHHKPPAYALLAVLLAAAAPGAVAAQQSDYRPWANPNAQAAEDTRVKALVERLNRLIDAAEKARAADPNFLRDLRALAGEYTAAGAIGIILRDDFSDGDFTRNPAWTLASGKFWVERGWGLRSAITAGAAASSGTSTRSNQDRAAQLFGAILNQALGGKQSGTQPDAAGAAGAQLHLDATVANGFAMEMDISSWSAAGEFAFAVYQGRFQGGGTPGYRLRYWPGGEFALLRAGASGVTVIQQSAGATPLENKKVHRIRWTRRTDGAIRVTVDSTTVLDAADRGFRDAFSGVALLNAGGDYIIKSIEISGAN